jgi:hypothetical protein
MAFKLLKSRVIILGIHVSLFIVSKGFRKVIMSHYPFFFFLKIGRLIFFRGSFVSEVIKGKKQYLGLRSMWLQ